jgi:hypothetical protein
VPSPGNESAFRAYLWWLAGAFLLSLASTALFNVWVNPYRLFEVFGDGPLTKIKARPDSSLGTVKLLNAVSARPAALIVGNSRADVGFSPDHPGWGRYRGRVYNLAVPGEGIQSVRDKFRAMIDCCDIRMALVAVDFQDFVLNAERVGPPVRSNADSIEALLRQQLLRALFTETGVVDSVRTLAASRQAYPATLRADGFNPLLDYIPVAARDGYPSMFRQKLNTTTVSFVRARKGIFPPGAADSGEFAALREILRLARAHNVDLHVLMYPYHAQYYLLFEQLGLWTEFERWKRAVLATCQDLPGSKGTGPRVILWDFSAFSAESMAPVESFGARGAGRWYWEAGHFKQALGDRVLDEVFGTDAGTGRRLGTRLTPGNVDSWLGLQRRSLHRFAVAQPAQLAEVEAALANVRKDATK